MIKNDRQFGIIRGRVERLKRLRSETEQRLATVAESERPRVDLELNAVEAEIQRMEEDLADYEALKEGRAEIGVVGSFEDLPRLLIRARIAAGLTHAQLAERLGIKEQQIQRYEATDYESASLTRLIEVAEVLNLRLSPHLGSQIQAAEPDAGLESVLARLSLVGLEQDFVERRIGSVAPKESRGLVSRLARVFRWLPEDILDGKVEPPRAAAVAYKMPTRVSRPKAAVLTAYARFLAELVAEATQPIETQLPSDPIAMHQLMGGGREPVSFAAALDAVWGCGVPVIPLKERGGFDAGYFRVAGRDVVVVNSVHREESRWLFYLLHDVHHVSETPDQPMLVENILDGETAATEGSERRANQFATEAIFGGRSEALFQLALEKSQGKRALLQRAVVLVARQQNVDAGALALNVAYRLHEQGEDWWGAAFNMQDRRGQPWDIARDTLMKHLNWSLLEPLDADLLGRALEVEPPLVAAVGETSI